MKESNVRDLLYFVAVVAWLMGGVLAKGFWPTTGACLFPPYAWYLAVEKLMQLAGIVP